MNYIKHLTGFFDRVMKDERLNPTHISLYVSLFQFWNVQRFNNPISISRNEVMQVSKICAKATYHKCMKELHNFGYLRYEPSFNPFRGSLVHLMNFEDDLKEVQKSDKPSVGKPAKNRTSSEQVLYRWQTRTEQALVPSINNTNSTNSLNLVNGGTHEQTEKIDVKILQPTDRFRKGKEKGCEKKKVEPSGEIPSASLGKNSSAKKVDAASAAEIPSDSLGKRKHLHPDLDEVQEYFTSQEYPSIEAEKFFNYFESNGWLVGGKTKMKDWQAAARNWILNTGKFNTTPKTSHLHASVEKNYGEPL
ncbi:MAG: hypothetical protein K2U26_12615 [Cyclobacteriaceae bacterium]|nr:hypothetical protein [Cyclobacteriaceae bacterium]